LISLSKETGLRGFFKNLKFSTQKRSYIWELHLKEIIKKVNNSGFGAKFSIVIIKPSWLMVLDFTTIDNFYRR